MKLVRPQLVMFIIVCSLVCEAVVVGILVIDADLNRAAFEQSVELGDNSVPPSYRFQIFDGIIRGDRQRIEKILKRRPKPGSTKGDGREAENLLEHAAYKGDVAILEMLLEHSIDTENADPISAAAAGGSDDAIEVLARRGYEINAPPEPCVGSSERNPANYLWRKNQNPVWAAVLNDQPVSILTLTRLGARLDLRDSDGSTSLHLAAIRGSLDVIHALLRSGADPKWTDARGRTSAQCAEAKGRLMAAILLRSQIGAGEQSSAGGVPAGVRKSARVDLPAGIYLNMGGRHGDS